MFKIIVDKQENKKIALIEKQKIIEYYIEEDDSSRKEGNIYLGVIRNVVKGMQAAFVDIGTEKNSFIHLKDILPKVDQKKSNEQVEEDLEKAIETVIKPGQKILVQVKKDCNPLKGARVSSHINLRGKYVALMPDTDIITISQKIENQKEQERLKLLIKKNISKNNGAVVRTAAEGKEQEIVDEIKYLENKWKNIKRKYSQDKSNKPKLLLEAENILERMILDLPQGSIESISFNDKEEYSKIAKIKEENKELKDVKLLLVENKNLLDDEVFSKQIEKFSNRKIWLKCGGFITIDSTEALTAIDVNTGKFTGKKDVEQTVFKVNSEATAEIARQLRLRDIGGIIIIDYIDMHKEKNKENIQKLLIEKLKGDRTKTQVEGFTKLNLMEMTRKHICSHKEEIIEERVD